MTALLRRAEGRERGHWMDGDGHGSAGHLDVTLWEALAEDQV